MYRTKTVFWRFWQEECIGTKVVQLTVTPQNDQDFEPFIVRLYARETLKVGSNMTDVKSMEEILLILPSYNQ